jgi:hypothetical protein
VGHKKFGLISMFVRYGHGAIILRFSFPGSFATARDSSRQVHGRFYTWLALPGKYPTIPQDTLASRTVDTQSTVYEYNRLSGRQRSSSASSVTVNVNGILRAESERTAAKNKTTIELCCCCSTI